MAIDVGVISLYLTGWLLRGAHHIADRTVDALLDRLANLIEQRIGPRTLRTLQKNPGDSEIARVSQKIATVAQRDPAFASELQALIRKLDQGGGQRVITTQVINAKQNVQAIGPHSKAAFGNIVDIKVPDPDDWSGAPNWVKATFGLGAVICALGLAIAILLLKNHPQESPGLGRIRHRLRHSRGWGLGENDEWAQVTDR